MIDFISRSVILVPQVIPHLGSGFYKTYDYMLQVIQRMVTNVYNGTLGGDFVDIMQSLISGQLTQAYTQAWEDSDETSILPDYLQSALSDDIAKTADFDYIYGYYRDIIDARVDKTPLDPLFARADLWANRYSEAYNNAVQLIEVENGGKLVWHLGATEEHCESCKSLDGVVAYASEWEQAGIKPQNAPNDKLECGGWKCDCSLDPTDQRRSPKALDTLMNIGMIQGV